MPYVRHEAENDERKDDLQGISITYQLGYGDTLSASYESDAGILSDFQAVWCGQNTILENLPEDSGILVYTTEY